MGYICTRCGGTNVTCEAIVNPNTGEIIDYGDWYLKMSEVKEYKPVTAEDMNPYILFKTSKFGNIKVRFPKDEDMDAELLVLDQLFDVE
mgnify:CR=1 FL=1|jgi:hypothetical protein